MTLTSSRTPGWHADYQSVRRKCATENLLRLAAYDVRLGLATSATSPAFCRSVGQLKDAVGPLLLAGSRSFARLAKSRFVTGISLQSRS